MFSRAAACIGGYICNRNYRFPKQNVVPYYGGDIVSPNKWSGHKNLRAATHRVFFFANVFFFNRNLFYLESLEKLAGTQRGRCRHAAAAIVVVVVDFGCSQSES